MNSFLSTTNVNFNYCLLNNTHLLKKTVMKYNISNGLNGTVDSVRMLIANNDKDNRNLLQLLYDHTDHDIYNFLEFAFMLYSYRSILVIYNSIFIIFYN